MKRIGMGIKVEMEKKYIEIFISMLSPFIDKAGYMDFNYNLGLYVIECETEYKEEIQRCFHFLSAYGKIHFFKANVFDLEEESYAERFIYIDDSFQHSVANIDGYYTVWEQEPEDYIQFRRLILLHGPITKEDDYYTNIKGLSSEMFYRAVKNTEKLEELERALALELGLDTGFDKSFGIELKLLSSAENKYEQGKMMIAYSEVDKILEIFIDVVIKEFNNYVTLPFDSTILEAANHEQEGIQVKWDIFEDNDPSIIVVSNVHANRLILEKEIEVMDEQRWVSPCSICDNRLRKLIEGCIPCEFQKIKI